MEELSQATVQGLIDLCHKLDTDQEFERRFNERFKDFADMDDDDGNNNINVSPNSRDIMKFVRKNYQAEWENVCDAIDAYINGVCNALITEYGASPDLYRYVARKLACEIAKYANEYKSDYYMPTD